MEWAAKADVQKGLRIIGSLTRYAEIRGNPRGGARVRAAPARSPGAREPTCARADALLGAGRIAWCRDNSEDALRFYREGIALLEKCGRSRDVILQNAFLGFVELNNGIDNARRPRFRKAIEAGKEFQDITLSPSA